MSNDLLKGLFFLLIILAVALEALADVLFKKWAIVSHSGLFIAGLVIYIFGTIIWAYSLKYGYLSKAISIFTVLNLVIVSLAGVFLFKEDLTLINKIGIILGIASVILVQI